MMEKEGTIGKAQNIFSSHTEMHEHILFSFKPYPPTEKKNLLKFL